jgi:hypothetical protein
MSKIVEWEQEWDRALSRARSEGKLVLADFFNPNWIGCQQMGAVTYPDMKVAEFLVDRVIPLQIPFNHQTLAAQFSVKWTPTLLTLDDDGIEHHRTVGFLGPDEFIPSLQLGMAKTYFDRERFDEAIKELETLIGDHPRSVSAPEAHFYLGVARYKHSHDPTPLRDAYDRLSAEFPDNEWTKRAYPYRLIGS